MILTFPWADHKGFDMTLQLKKKLKHKLDLEFLFLYQEPRITHFLPFNVRQIGQALSNL